MLIYVNVLKTLLCLNSNSFDSQLCNILPIYICFSMGSFSFVYKFEKNKCLQQIDVKTLNHCRLQMIQSNSQLSNNILNKFYYALEQRNFPAWLIQLKYLFIPLFTFLFSLDVLNLHFPTHTAQSRCYSCRKWEICQSVSLYGLPDIHIINLKTDLWPKPL